MILAKIIGGAILILMGLSLFQPIQSALSLSMTNSNVNNSILVSNYIGNSPARVVLNIAPYLFTGVCILLGIFMILSSFINLEEEFPDYEEDEEDEEEPVKKEKPHKQTYKEFVEEQLEVERMMRHG